MKKLYTIIAALVLTASTFAQSQEKMSYQALVRDASGQAISNQAVGMQITILQTTETGTGVYIETQNTTTNANGLVSVEIGDGTVVSGDFMSIDWEAGPYFIKIETDPMGGTNYTITGINQLLSVPYALQALSAETIIPSPETDPFFSNNFDYTGAVHGNLLHKYIKWSERQNNFISDYTVTEADVTKYEGALSFNESQISDLQDYKVTESDPRIPDGTQRGDMQYWDGKEWVTVAAGNNGQLLTFAGGVPTWTTVVGLTDVANPTTGKIWMDRNLGASQVAEGSNDAASYGDLYQWGRAADGHQLRTSGTTSTNATTAEPDDGNDWNGKFITEGSSPYDWLTTQDDDLWQGVSGTNNPCPSGYRLPTKAEWENERLSWGSNNAAGAFNSPLSLPVAGYRSQNSGSLGNVASAGYYWSSTVVGTEAGYLDFFSIDAYVGNRKRAIGSSVRCLKD